MTITGPDAHHIARVLRLTAGDTIELFDGRGMNYTAVIKGISTDGVTVSISNSRAAASESILHLAIGVGMLKGNKLDKLIPPLSELGVAELLPFYSKRTIPASRAGQLQNRMARWQKIGIESLKQCRRSRTMDIHLPGEFADTLNIAETYQYKMLFWEDRRDTADKLQPLPGVKPGSVFLLLGPEGGFDSAEVDAARRSGFMVASLGPRILKAETAVITACALAQYVFGDMGNNT